jgi:predicted RND superfamily exporter protein
MTKFTIAAYYFFKKYPVIFYLFFLLSSLFFIYFGSKVEFEEDISKLLPSTEESEGTEKVVFANLKVKDKLFILFSSDADTITAADLAEACGGFIDSLLVKDSLQKNPVIEDALYRIDDHLLRDGISFLYANIPLFLDSMDYVKMDSMLTEESIKNRMSENFMTLLSPAGMAFRDMLIQDPLAFRNIFIAKLNDLQESLGGNYTVVDRSFFTPDTVVAIAFISPNFQSFNSKESIKLIEILEDQIEQFEETNPAIKVSYHGAPAQSVYNSRQIKKDLAMTLIVSLVIICGIILYCFRNKTSLIQLILPVIYGTFFSLSVIYFIKGTMSLQAMGIGAVVLGVALSYCLHVLTHYKYVNDPVVVLKDQTVPVILGCLTTIGAFAALLFTKAELLKDFGVFASLALIGTTFISLFFLPQFFNPEKNKRSDKAFAWLEKINSYPLERQTKLIIGIVILSIICAFTSRWVVFDSDLKNIGYNEKKVVESQKLLAAHTTQDYITTYYAAASRNLDSALVYSQHMMVLLDSLQQEKKIWNYSEASSLFIPLDEQQDRIEKWNNFWTKDRKSQVRSELTKAASGLNLNPAMFSSFFEMLDKKYEPVSLYDAGMLPSSILANMIEYTDSIYIVFTPVQLKREDLGEVSDIIASDKNFLVVDPFYYTQDMVKIINNDFNVILGLSSLFVLIVLLISYKSVILAILGFLPMALSWYIVLGIMGIFGLQFNLINIVISTFIFGVGVDYSIFVMDGLLAGFRIRTRLLAYHKTAIFFSAIVLIIGIASLLFATHPAISSIGLSTLIGMSTALIIAYSLQPFLFYWLIKRPVLRGRAPVTVYNLLHAESYFGKKGFTPVQKIRNNYAYKGNNVERALRKELKLTGRYSLITPYIKDDERVLEYGCAYGFIAYWFLINSKHTHIVGYDTDKEDISIPKHCYLKNRYIRFTADRAILLKDCYDVVIFNKAGDMEEGEFQQIISKAHTVIVRKEGYNKIQTSLQSYGFSEVASDSLFVVLKNT